jgi:hypothetical protein
MRKTIFTCNYQITCLYREPVRRNGMVVVKRQPERMQSPAVQAPRRIITTRDAFEDKD